MPEIYNAFRWLLENEEYDLAYRLMKRFNIEVNSADILTLFGGVNGAREEELEGLLIEAALS